TSMVATTFAADTPLAVTGMVARNGIAGNWLWWNFVASGMLTVFFYARLWRQARRFSTRIPCDLSGYPHQLHHPRLGQPRHGENPGLDPRCQQARGSGDRSGH